MDAFSKQEMNYALLGMYVGTRGPKTLRKCITDKLFTYQMWRYEETIREHLDADMVLLVFPEGQPVPSLDELDDLVVPDIGLLAFDLSTNKQDISKLRNSIQGILEGTVFHKYLYSREKQFRRKNSKTKLLSRIQFSKLYPDGSDTNIHDLDITLLCFVLFEGMGFRPISDLDKLPSESVITEADDMLRIKICRNILVHHPVAELCDEDFDIYWECLTWAFERLLKSACVRRESERLKSLRLSDEKIDQFKAMIQQWRMDDDHSRREHLEEMKDIAAQSRLQSDSIPQASGPQIIETQNGRHDEHPVYLLKKSSLKRRRVPNKELKKSFPLHVHGYDKFKQLCHIMHEEGIKYTLPTSSTSADATPNSDGSSSSNSSGLRIPRFDVDIKNKPSSNLRRSRSLPRYRPTHHNDMVRGDKDTAHSIINSTDNATGIIRVADFSQERQWKRSLSEKSRNTQENRSPRPGNAIRMGVRSFHGGKLSLFDWKSPENSDAEPESAGCDSKQRMDPSNSVNPLTTKTSEKIMKSFVQETTSDAGDPTGYFLSLMRRDEYIHSKTDTSVGCLQHKQNEQPVGDLQQIVQPRTETSPLDNCLLNVVEEEDNTSLSATSGEYVIGDDEDQRQDVMDIGDNVPSKGGMYSEDSTGYNTDLLTLNSSLDGNTSSDTLLFHPLRLPLLQSSPIRYKGRKPLTAKKDEKASKDSVNANVTDDGYASNGYFSSLDRHHPACQEQYENNVLDNAANAFEQREDCFNNHTETDNNELRHDKHAPEVERLIENSKSKRKKGFSLRNCFRNCIFCGGQNVENEQENPINVNESLRRRESERCLLSSRDPIDTPEPIMRMQLWETHRSDRGSQTDQTDDDGEHELKEIFV